MSDKRAMFYGATSKIFELAKLNRKNLTKSESILWSRLRNNQLGLRIRSQHPFGRYIADFYCHEHKLVIELDGEYHNSEEQKILDEARNDTLKSYGIGVIRFSNEEIENDLEAVIKSIKEYINSASAL